ncbi:hypothetical protein JXA59_00355 [Patescibacteria group bacterium]|nr:hypothetical protein [Patescibacteria group bacterium]
MGELNALVRAVGGVDNLEGILNGSKQVTVNDIPLFTKIGTATITPTNSGDAVRLLSGKLFVQFANSCITQMNMHEFLLEEFKHRKSAPIPKMILSYTNLQRKPVRKEFSYRSFRGSESLPDSFVFESGTLFSLLFDMLSLQINGEKGHLITNGGGNVFYAGHRENVTDALYPLSVCLVWHAEPHIPWYMWIDPHFNNPGERYLQPGNRIFIPGDHSVFTGTKR